MNVLTTTVLTPWRCGQRSMRLVASVLMLLIALGLTAAGVLVHTAHAAVPLAVMVCFSLFFLWGFFYSGTLLLAIDARNLRLPAVERRVVLSLIAHAAFTAIGASLILSACGLDTNNTVAALVLAMLTGLGFAIFPRYVAVLISMLPGLSIGFRRIFDMPGLDAHGFAYWAWLAALIMLAADAVRWRQMLRADHHLAQGLSSTVVMQLRRGGAMGEWTAMCSPDLSGMIRNRPDWMQAAADLRKVGPGQPVNALRVALGGWYMPRTAGGHVRGLAPVLLPMLAVLAAMFLISFADAKTSADTWLGFGAGMLAGVCGFGAMLIALMGVMSLRRRWIRVNSELPLLALLPGLGGTREVKRNLLRASLRLPLSALAALWLILFVLACAAHTPATGLLALTLGMAGCAGATTTLMLNTLGGHPVPAWLLGTITVVVFTLLGPSLFVPLLALGHEPWPHAHLIAWILDGLWIALGLGMLGMARRGWRDLFARPHAFLTNPR